MPKFYYQAINDDGTAISGDLEAQSIEDANNMLLNKGYIPYQVKKSKNISLNINLSKILGLFHSVSPKDLIIFTKQFRTMIKAGVPMLELWRILEDQTENSKLKNIINLISKDMQEGINFHDAFKKFPEIFSPLYCSIIQAGELSGKLDLVLELLTEIIEHEYKITSDIKSALRYPTYVLAFLAIAFLIQLTFVIPRFVPIFIKRGVDLPLPTLICMKMYQFLEGYWHFTLIGFIILLICLFSYFKAERIKYFRDLCFMKMPVFGPLFIKASMSRFASIFSILQYSGVSILESLAILSGVLNNKVIAREFKQIKQSIEQGSNIASPLRSAKYFTPMVVNMIAVGEQTGNLDAMLKEIADHYDSEVDYAMKGIGETISTMLTIGIAVVIGFFAFAIFLPMWDMAKIIH